MNNPVVFTAGVRYKDKWKPSTKIKNKQQQQQQQEDEEAGGEDVNNSPPTPTIDNRVSPNDNSTTNPMIASLAAADVVVDNDNNDNPAVLDRARLLKMHHTSVKLDDLYSAPPVIRDDEDLARDQLEKSKSSEYFWLAFCFFGIMGSFVCYGLLLEFATSGGKHLHELSFLFVTSLLYTVTASVGRYVRAEERSTIPPAQFAVLGLTSMGSTFFSVRALRYVIYPIQVLAKSCKPVPVMLMGALMGKHYPPKKYVKVVLIVGGVGLFMGGGENKKDTGEEKDASSQLIGVTLLFISLCFDGGTGAYEDKLMSVHSVGPFDLMYNIQMGKTILAGIGLIVLNQVHVFAQMCQDMGFLLVALGLSGAIGQVFIFVTISKFGALTCSIIGLARKVTTLVASIYFYGHHLNKVQAAGLVVCVGAMVNDFFGKKGKKGGHGHGHGVGDAHGGPGNSQQVGFKDALEEHQPMLPNSEEGGSTLEMGTVSK
mmetsp:Transcript_29831/g.54803  ORF Transcript_29831/g.54803 Transcript_29831/m.54803 type:complete len:484 (-) Transcript_29831:348-1799(-)|eukprot:CAMPEP_0201633946 /NCGR_PEP_ID=MMETSP0493-20130528/7071_1 /ASSEMBLY_ACC=CAM_ASM_000838 /TAXON_ID=420259 /ORGANISM="Thalassiosira gravida, Strain GMp14c1" /LENGTH=483 /DNA_ID=CAMNT_0048105729 /DNA_START=94 /DNA_END=1545 /DNA_ORIENTATION=+